MSMKVIEVLDSSQVGALQEMLRRYEQKASEHGIQLTPTKTGSQSIANDQDEDRIRAGKRLPLSDQDHGTLPGFIDATKDTPDPNFQHQRCDVKQWCSEFRQEMTAQTSKQFNKFAEKASKILTNVKKPELQAAAVK